MQNSDAVMETFDEADNEMADEQKIPEYIIARIKAVGCANAKVFCDKTMRYNIRECMGQKIAVSRRVYNVLS